MSLMNFDVTINGRPWKVALDPAEQTRRMLAVVRGRRRAIDTAWIDGNTLSLISLDEGSSHRVHEIGIRRRNRSELELLLQGRTVHATVSVQPPAGGRPSSDQSSPKRVSERIALDPVEGRQMITTPMPGRVVRVLVAPGDQVVARQALVVVEAMKMENELRSPKDGIVKEITVVAGAAVEAGAVLMVIG
jgi:biotin carboxyl carrier protein